MIRIVDYPYNDNGYELDGFCDIIVSEHLNIRDYELLGFPWFRYFTKTGVLQINRTPSSSSSGITLETVGTLEAAVSYVINYMNENKVK